MTNKGADSMSDPMDWAAGRAREKIMTQPNEQLIETIRDVVTAVDRTGYTIATWHSNDEIAGWLRALLKENKRLTGELQNCQMYYDEQAKVESLHTELEAKDKVLQWYGDSHNHGYKALIEWDAGTRARTVLQSYPPREKGATE